ncbi:acetate--CoA ligase family protein [Poseidonocella sedimentorum]|uniref:Acetyltransferase n=1 Tax=Poseidonocella sedimentorum TaxID=871652 RepID=A0A1I6DVE3_9RHOB|nr:acetate--CoA ligase family protein [Poseidonocella sedimentorum]SFR09459.1 acetyltransferase [Poseidonocella sedimentorum]
MSFEPFLNPAAIAVYGASERETSPAAHILRNLLTQGFGGEIIAINPKYETVAGHPCVASQVAGGRRADLAVLAIPPQAVPAALRDCGAVGTRAAIVITAGFNDGDGPAGRERLLRVAREAGIRLIGPNCLGLLRPRLRMNATFQPAMPAPGGLALLSQSGAICSGLADMADGQGLGFSFMVSLGNSYDFGLSDALEMACTDPETTVIAMYVEGVRDGARFRAALSEACRRKPVIVLKAGRHAESAEAAATHTGALVGSDRVFSTVLREAGAVQVATLGGLLDAGRLLTAAPRLPGGRLAIVTNGGGAGVLAADRLSDRRLHPAPLPQDLRERLDGVLSRNWSRRNPIDIVGDATAAQYRATIDACLDSEGFDAVLTLLSPQSMTAPDLVADAVLAAHHRAEKPVLSCFLGGASVASARARLRRQRVPDFDLPENAVQAFAAALQASTASPGAPETPRIAAPRGPDEASGLARTLAELGPLPAGLLSDTGSRRLLASAGIPCPVPQPAATAQEAVRRFVETRGPVVLKIASPDISHKSEVEGVRLNLRTGDAVEAAFREIVAAAQARRPDARIEGVTVEPMLAPAHPRELLVGVNRDPVFGHVLTFGAGGTLVELLDDVATALLPLTPGRATELIARTKIARLLGDYRNMPAVDARALAELLVAVSDLCTALPQIAEMDINPLIASPEGLFAVDARIRLEAEVTPLLTGERDDLG